jgi:hypothetical protein
MCLPREDALPFDVIATEHDDAIPDGMIGALDLRDAPNTRDDLTDALDTNLSRVRLRDFPHLPIRKMHQADLGVMLRRFRPLRRCYRNWSANDDGRIMRGTLHGSHEITRPSLRGG